MLHISVDICNVVFSIMINLFTFPGNLIISLTYGPYIQTVIVRTWTHVREHSKSYLCESYYLLNPFLHMSISPSGPLSCPNHTTSVNKNHELFTCQGILTHENKTLCLIFFCINLKEMKTVLCFRGYGGKRTG